ncbi:sel1 repeat family protein [Helicobacter aurati]|uniref:Beta-lactamase n=2 Tax=Helicobacter aurati TaxID=137778 RepID=A0A3D8J3E5_9HELI|nr:sel1 repeat family protein [Helicobacter aurati]
MLFYMIVCCAQIPKFLQHTERELVVKCANYHLHSCERLLSQGVPNLASCDVRTECEFVGWLYAQVQEYELSLPYLYKACRANHLEACDKLGISYQRLNNYKKAKKFYKLGCDKNYVSACYNLATLYYEGLGVRHNYEYANILYKQVCDSNEGIGCLHLAISYAKGHGVIKNIEKARVFFEKACTLGNNEGCNFYDAYQEENQQ